MKNNGLKLLSPFLAVILLVTNVLTVNLAFAEDPDYTDVMGPETQVLTTGAGLDGEIPEGPDWTDAFRISFIAGNTYVITLQYGDGYTIGASTAFFMYDSIGTPIATVSGGESPYKTLTYVATETETLYVLVRENGGTGTYHISYTETEPTFAGGDGSEEDPYQIASCQQLQNINTDLTAFYILNNDIDCSATSISDEEDPDYDADLYSGGQGFTPLGGPGCDIQSSDGTFTGTLDGAGFTVDNLTIDRGGGSCVAVFARSFGTVENINFTNAVITGTGEYTGVLVARVASGGVVSNASAQNVVVVGGTTVGGLIGGSWGTVTESFSTGTVSGAGQVGGLMGVLVYSTLTNSYSTADVSGLNLVGGLLGDSAWSNNITANYASGNVIATEGFAGGLIGRIYTASLSMNYNYATGSVAATEGAGGLIGQFLDSIGEYDSDLLANNYWDSSTTGSDVCIADPQDELNESRPDPENFQYGCNNVDTSLVAIPDNYWFDFTKAPLANWDDDIWYFLTGAYPTLSSTPEDVTFADGSGTVEDPYQVNSCQQLQNIGSNETTLAASYLLIDDIDCSATNISDVTDSAYNGRLYNGGAGFAPIGTVATPFTGSFDGDGYVITGLFINRTDIQYVGLFGYVVGAGVTIANIGLEEVDITGGPTYVGALVGGNNEGTITYSYSTGTVDGGDRSGGLVGENVGSIAISYSSTDVNGTGYVGGLVGHNSGPISNVYSTGDVIGNEYIGGFLGYNSGTITNVYSTGSTSDNGSATYLGGLVGINEDDGTIIDSFWDSETSGQAESDGGTGKTTAEMKEVTTFTDLTTDGLLAAWDFVNNPNDDENDDDIWDIGAAINGGYPSLTAFTYEPDLPTIQFTSTSSSGEEAETTVNLELSLSVVSEASVNVDYAITGGTATVADDYTFAASTATVTAGETTTNLELIIHEDGTDESNETIEITISNPGNATLGDNTTFTYTITDDDLPNNITLSATDGVATTEDAFTLAPSEVSGISVRFPASMTLTAPVEWDGSISATATDSYDSLANITIKSIFDSSSEVISVDVDMGLDSTVDLDDEVIITLPFTDFSSLSTPTVFIYHSDGTTLTVTECTTEFTGDTTDADSLNDSTNWTIEAGSACYVVGTNELESNLYIGTKVLSIFTAGEGASAPSPPVVVSSGGGGGGSKANKLPVIKIVKTNTSQPTNSQAPTSSNIEASDDVFDVDSFVDTQDNWAKDFLQELLNKGALEVKSKDRLEPNSPFSRAEMIKTALIFFDWQIQPSYDSGFSDVPKDNEYKDYISAAKRAGIIEGQADGTFGLNALVTRAEALKIIFKAAGKNIEKAFTKAQFKDLEQDAWYLDLINYSLEKGIINGKNPKIFAPNEGITKAEMAKVAVKVKRL